MDATSVSKRNWAPRAVIPFKGSSGHKSEKKSFPIPDGYSYESLKRGFEATTTLKKPKTLVNMANSPNRDNSMYGNLDAEYVKAVKKEQRQKNFDMSVYLPNSMSMTKDRSMRSMTNYTMLTEGAKVYKKVAMSAHKGQSGSINRLASLASLAD